MRLVRLAVLTAALVGSAACAPDETPPPGRPDPANSAAPTGHGGYAHCLAEHGVTAPPGPEAGPPAGVDHDTWDRATRACASLAPGPPPG